MCIALNAGPHRPVLLFLFYVQAVLEVYFQRYSLPSEMFTDEGLIALTEGCRSLKRLTLHNCDRVSDRCGHAAAATTASACMSAREGCGNSYMGSSHRSCVQPRLVAAVFSRPTAARAVLTCAVCVPALRRSMYAVAANCLELEVLTLGGYNEHVTDGGITVLLEACRNLHTVKLSSKLLKVGRRVLVC